jgi:hypothetical protein
MRRFIALSAVAAAVSFAPVSYASYVGSCTGQVDTNCRAWICQGNCFQRDCAIWINVVPGTPLCISPVA